MAAISCVDIFNFIIGGIVIVGCVITYGFQIVELLRSRTTFGVSFFTFLMGSFTLLTLSWLCPLTIILLYMWYYVKENDPVTIFAQELRKKVKKYKKKLYPGVVDEDESSVSTDSSSDDEDENEGSQQDGVIVKGGGGEQNEYTILLNASRNDDIYDATGFRQPFNTGSGSSDGDDDDSDSVFGEFTLEDDENPFELEVDTTEEKLRKEREEEQMQRIIGEFINESRHEFEKNSEEYKQKQKEKEEKMKQRRKKDRFRKKPFLSICCTVTCFFVFIYVVLITSFMGVFFIRSMGFKSLYEPRRVESQTSDKDSFKDSYQVIYTTILSYISSFCVFIQWIPQIVVTTVERGKGSLSRVMVVLLIIGILLATVFLIIGGQSPLLWVPYMVAIFQLIILVILFIFFDGFDCFNKMFSCGCRCVVSCFSKKQNRNMEKQKEEEEGNFNL